MSYTALRSDDGHLAGLSHPVDYGSGIEWAKVYMYIYVYIYMYMYVYIFIYIYKYVCIYIYMYI
jgi:hypothetical protein